MRFSNREVFPALLFAGLKGHIFLSVPLLFYVLSTIDGRIVFYLLLVSFQSYVCTLIGVALFIRDGFISRLTVSLLRLFSVFCWGGIAFMVYALIGSVVYARFYRPPPSPKHPTAIVAVAQPPERTSPFRLVAGRPDAFPPWRIPKPEGKSGKI